MGFAALVRKGVKLANKLTGDLQATITLDTYVSASGGTKTYKTTHPKALVNLNPRLVKSMSGQLINVRASVVILDPTIVVTPNDRITLPDGLSGPIVGIVGLVDPSSKNPYLTEVLLG